MSYGDRPFYLVDAFTDTALRGNPAAVLLLEDGDELTDEVRQQIAAECAQAETAFVRPPPASDPSQPYSLAWFTPKCEVDLCGHATLASAAALDRQAEADGVAIAWPVRFVTKKGLALTVDKATAATSASPGPMRKRVRRAGADATAASSSTVPRPIARYSLDFPQNPPRPLPPPSQMPLDLVSFIKGLLARVCVDWRRVVTISHSASTAKLIVEVDAESVVREARCAAPDALAVADAGSVKSMSLVVRGLAVTARGEASFYAPGTDVPHFVSRYWAPWVGIPEDAVTGSLHTVLLPHWRARGITDSPVLAHQASPRGGFLLLDDKKAGRVSLTGAAVPVVSGTFAIPSF
jgi:predicted PhzF superfamily epimerase YddE/YHI9